mgnify:CR=1 FL=1
MKQTNLQKAQVRLREKFIKNGVKMLAPETVYFSKDTKIGKNVTIEPYVVLGEKVKIQNNSKIKSFSHLENVKIENNVTVGPFARLRPGTVLKSGSRVGNFVEIKKSSVGKNSKINHLSYIGDTNIGNFVNIGAGTITCNYDGKNKNKTIIKNKVFVGSNSSLVAPVTLNEKSTIGAGSVITKNVKKNSLALTRSNQSEVKNYKRIITQETLDWWKSQGSEAQKWITPSDDDQKISKLYDWFWENSPTDIKNFYTRGNTFDPIFLQSLMADTDRPMPYNWWQIRDTRSYIEGLAWGSELIHDYIPPGCEGFTKHDPKHDIALDVMRMQTIARAIV